LEHFASVYTMVAPHIFMDVYRFVYCGFFFFFFFELMRLQYANAILV
jgi:hypothetical protein